MVLAEAPHRSLLQDSPPEIRNFLQFYGTVCSVPTVARVGTLIEGGTVHFWVQLNDDDESGQNAIYDALRRFQAADVESRLAYELHVVFADEDESSYPTEVDILFSRE